MRNIQRLPRNERTERCTLFREKLEAETVVSRGERARQRVGQAILFRRGQEGVHRRRVMATEQEVVSLTGDVAHSPELAPRRQNVAIERVELKDGAHSLVEVALGIARERVQLTSGGTKSLEARILAEALEEADASVDARVQDRRDERVYGAQATSLGSRGRAPLLPKSAAALLRAARPEVQGPAGRGADRTGSPNPRADRRPRARGIFHGQPTRRAPP